MGKKTPIVDVRIKMKDKREAIRGSLNEL